MVDVRQVSVPCRGYMILNLCGNMCLIPTVGIVSVPWRGYMILNRCVD